MSTMQELIDKYGYNEPIILKNVSLSGISDASVRQTFSRMTKLGQIKRYEQGIYYIPSGESSRKRISAKKVFERKYISDKGAVYGFYSGQAFLNEIGLTSQVSNVIEIVTNRQKSRMRKVENGKEGQEVIIRRTRVNITPDNVKTLQLLELMNSLDVDELTEQEREKLDSYIGEQDLKRSDVSKYISKFPVKAARNLIESGAFIGLI